MRKKSYKMRKKSYKMRKKSYKMCEIYINIKLYK
jgi:hypothetical protein